MTSAPPSLQTLDVHVVSHTHWDREWYLPFEHFRLRLVALVDRVLDLLESQPEFRHFHLDGQTIVLEDYLELRPAEEARLARLVEQGRLLIGPWYDMPDEFLVSGESLLRNLARGHRVARRFGAPMPVGYLPDLFGHVAQMPQLLRGFGLDNAVLWRGFGGPRAEYWWVAPDGSRVLMMHLPPEGYCNGTRVHFKPELMVERAAAKIQVEAQRTAVGQVLLMNGVDHVEPHPVIPELVRQLGDALGARVRHSTLPAYVDAVRAAVERGGPDLQLETVRGELRGGEDYANLLPGVLSARVYLKQANARVQTLLERWAEPLSAFAAALGARYPREELQYAWKTLLQNHPHDSICGCSVDAVHEENMTRFARAGQVAEGLRDRAVEVIARAVPAAGAGAWRVVAVNPGAQPYAGAIEAIVELPFESAEPQRAVDQEALDAPVVFVPVDARVGAVRAPDGALVPVQVLGEEFVTAFVMSRYETPWALRARRLRLLWMGTVPACGYAVFDLLLDGTAPAAPGPKPVGSAERSAENEYLRVLVNDDGTVDVVDRRSGTRFARCGAFEDVGDVGDEYNYSPPAGNARVTSADAADVRITRVHAGPVRAAFRIDLTLPLPEAASPDRASRSPQRTATPVSLLVSLDAGSPRVQWEATIDNRARDHRLRMLFPAGADTVADVRAETAFGVVRRPARREVPPVVRNERPVSAGPAISFVDAGAADIGAIVHAAGLHEHEVSADDEFTGARIGLTLLRCVGDLSRDDLVTRPSGHAGPGLATPGAQCPGVHTFRLAFEPRGAELPASALFARSAAFLAPPLVAAAAGAAGAAPLAASFLTVEAARGGAVLSACMRAGDRDSLVVRLFNPDDTAATVRVRTAAPIAQAFVVDFLEERTQELPVRDGAVEAALGPHAIRTIELVTG